MKKVFIRVDAYKEIGIGHLTRCMALAEMLKKYFKVTFLCQTRDGNTLKIIESSGFTLIPLPIQEISKELLEIAKIVSANDILVLDGYLFDGQYQAQLKKTVSSLVVIDDLNNSPIIADLIINHNLHAVNEVYPTNDSQRVIKGAQYLLLRPDFFAANSKRTIIPKEINSILVCMGGADRENLTAYFVQDLHTFFKGKITLIVGSAYAYYEELKSFCQDKPNITLLQNLNSQSLIQEIKTNDLLFCTSSMIAAEACAIGVPLVLGYMEKNQEKIAELFHQEGLAHSLGNLMQKKFNLQQVIKQLKINEQLTAQSKLIDGKSSARIVDEFKHLGFKNLRLETERFLLRPLISTDVTDEYVSWFENDDTKRFIQTSKDSDSKSKLIKYVQDKRSKADVLFLGIFDKLSSKHIGNIKFEPINWEKSYAIMGILIGEINYRGKGVSSEVLVATAKYLKELGLSKMVLGVENDNFAAIKSYQKVGFKKTDEFIKFPEPNKAIEMTLELNE